MKYSNKDSKNSARFSHIVYEIQGFVADPSHYSQTKYLWKTNRANRKLDKKTTVIVIDSSGGKKDAKKLHHSRLNSVYNKYKWFYYIVLYFSINSMLEWVDHHETPSSTDQANHDKLHTFDELISLS